MNGGKSSAGNVVITSTMRSLYGLMWHCLVSCVGVYFDLPSSCGVGDTIVALSVYFVIFYLAYKGSCLGEETFTSLASEVLSKLFASRRVVGDCLQFG